MSTFLLPDSPLSGELTDIDPALLDEYRKRVAAYKKQYPNGEPMFKMKGPYRMFIYAEDLEIMHRITLRAAQRKLANIRVLLELPPNNSVTVKQYCRIEEIPEEEVRDYLNKLDEQNGYA